METLPKIEISANGRTFTMTPCENSSASALVEKLEKGSLKIEMEDYAGMEKVGTLPFSLPQNNRQIQTNAGDVILYLGNHFVIYYGTNSWSLTHLGKIDGATREQLLETFGTGSVNITLSLKKGNRPITEFHNLQELLKKTAR